jgi:hypothetical protein
MAGKVRAEPISAGERFSTNLAKRAKAKKERTKKKERVESQRNHVFW